MELLLDGVNEKPSFFFGNLFIDQSEALFLKADFFELLELVFETELVAFS